MSEAIAKEYDVIIIGCGIAGSVVGAILSNMAHKRVLILEASSQVGGRATSFRGEGITDADAFRKTLALSAHSWVSDRSEPDLPTMIEKKMLNGQSGAGSFQ
jgi:monoamine oxidase